MFMYLHKYPKAYVPYPFKHNPSTFGFCMYPNICIDFVWRQVYNLKALIKVPYLLCTTLLFAKYLSES